MNYSNVKAKALKALKKNGSLCVLTKHGEEVYNAETNEYEQVTESYEGNAIVSSYDLKNIDGTNILAGDARIMAVLNVLPAMGDKIKVGNDEFTVINVNPFAPDGVTTIYYIIQGRR